jgi:hypothetical protein
MASAAADAPRLVRRAVRDLEAATTLGKRIKAAEALAALARAGRGREVAAAGGARPLLALLASPSNELLAAAAEALCSMCTCGDDVRLDIAAAGAGEAIGAALQQQPLTQQRWKRLADLLLLLAAKRGGQLMVLQDSRQLVNALLRHPGCLEQLMRVAEGSGAAQQLQDPDNVAALILWLAAEEDPTTVAALRPSLADFLQLLASAPSPRARGTTELLLGALAERAELRPRLAAAGAVAVLLQDMQQAPTDPGVQHGALRILRKLCQDCGVARQATDAGAAQTLVAVLRAHQPPPPGSPDAWSCDSARVSWNIADALATLVISDSRAAVQAVEAGAAPLLAQLLRPPSRQTLALAQREGWTEELDQALGAGGWTVAQLCNCGGGGGGGSSGTSAHAAAAEARRAHADAARRALRAAGVMKLLIERLRACPASVGRAWAQAVEILAAMIEVGDGSGGAASAHQPQPRLLGQGQEDEDALELLPQALLSASEPEQQARAARALALLVERSGSSEVAAHLVRRGALGRARQLAASSAAAGAEPLESALLLLRQLEALVEPEQLEVLEQHWRQQQQQEQQQQEQIEEGLRARATGAGPAGPGAGSSSAGGAERTAAAGGAANSLGACAVCGAANTSDGAKLRKCAGCRAVRYCSPACQKAHWREHRAACKAAQQAQGRQQ